MCSQSLPWKLAWYRSGKGNFLKSEALIWTSSGRRQPWHPLGGSIDEALPHPYTSMAYHGQYCALQVAHVQLSIPPVLHVKDGGSLHVYDWIIDSLRLERSVRSSSPTISICHSVRKLVVMFWAFPIVLLACYWTSVPLSHPAWLFFFFFPVFLSYLTTKIVKAGRKLFREGVWICALRGISLRIHHQVSAPNGNDSRNVEWPEGKRKV